MKWGQIKTIFIICFLVLDYFLLTQYLSKANSEPQALPDEEAASFQDELDARNINYEKIPSEAEKTTFISANQYQFTKKDIASLNDQKVVNDGDIIVSTFEEPISIPEELSEEELNNFLDQNILFGDEYQFWSWNKDQNILLFFQSYNDKTIYFNKAGMLMIFLNDNNEMEYYAQTRLSDIEIGEEREVSQPLETLEVLSNNDQLFTNDEITKMKLGYQTLVPFENGQVFVPTWEISINDERTYFVNAIEARSISRDEEQFIKEIRDTVETIRQRDTGSDES
ncbi:Two-component signal transduction system YycFG, regulatory protein YycI [Salinibacillus kushneri]|uniref:Two-component signal transduction system YycFG, regulatory protein YycI n=1 Tax=Salinibacillus kushneri TaxID=237682 RepID=A0A1I0C8R6_9BACI|nr:two-component system regulatory protein YycI [Salinibacillus kushneri]SET15781.1 Two-component signal transduction system YycFG, regulatory protein YycI [Salinibacillus kushneri]